MLVVGALIDICQNGVDPVDGGVAIWRDGTIQFAIAEERITRKKYDGGFRGGLERGLEQLGYKISEVTDFSFVTYGEPFSISQSSLLQRHKDIFSYGADLYVCRSHHHAHALYSFRQSVFCEALIVVLDNEGQIIGPQKYKDPLRNCAERLSYFLGHKDSVDLLTRDLYGTDNVSLGEMYRRFNYYCGFPSHQQSGKTMALAAYGKASRFYGINIVKSSSREITVDLKGMNNEPANSVIEFFDKHSIGLSPSRKCLEPFTQDHFDAASYIQHQLEKSLIKRIKRLLFETKQKSLVVAGGVAYNCQLISKLENALSVPVFVPPSPGDQGISIGAVYDCLESKYKIVPKDEANPYLGGKYNADEALNQVSNIGGVIKIKFNRKVEWIDEIVKSLLDNKIIIMFQGRSEVGRRALCNRSLLAIPDEATIKKLQELKNREFFRPFGVALLSEHISHLTFGAEPDHLMLRVSKVKGGISPELDLVTHRDGTIRGQKITKETNPVMYAIMTKISQLKGSPSVLINTSLNADGEPIIETPSEAIIFFTKNGIIDDMFFDWPLTHLKRIKQSK
jgi:carbamoyltransferase